MDSDSEIFIDSNLNLLEKSFQINGEDYEFLKFAKKPDHLFVYSEHCEFNCYEVCYCYYSIQGGKITIEDVVGCYSKEISSLDRISELETPND